jgi:hypothetical protein
LELALPQRKALSTSMQIRPFSEINAAFRKKLSDSAVYTSHDQKFSFLKIFQHAISYAMIGDRSKLIRNYFNLPYTAHLLLHDVKSKVKSPTVFPPIQKDIALIDPGRSIQDEYEITKSVYFDQVQKCLDELSTFTMVKKKTPGLVADLILDGVLHRYGLQDKEEKKMLRRLYDVKNNAQRSAQFNQEEIDYLMACLHLFYDDFRFYYRIFRGSSVKKVYFICHYHNEGLLAALKILNIRSIELQHGLISGNDLYYVYDRVFTAGVKQAFFPDKILVFGEYWKKVLCRGVEFTQQQIDVAGDYIFRKRIKSNQQLKKQNLILICSQKGMHEDYISYCKKLADQIEHHPDWTVVVKLHPLETNRKAYDAINHQSIEIALENASLDDLLRRAKIQISIYSTTFYDAIGLDVTNLSIQNFGTSADYAADIIREGVAYPITIDDDPIAVYESLKGLNEVALSREDVYAPINCNVLRNA